MVLGPGSTLLVDRDGASWIVYPMPPRGLIRPAVELTTRFTRSFDLPRGAPGGSVELRAFRDATVTVNGSPVRLAPAADWKDPRRAELEGVLRAGRNQITVACSNDSGPPALLLLLEAGETRVVSDGSWSSSLEGSPERPARLAAAPIDVTAIDPATAEIRPWAGLRAHADWLVVYTALAMLALWALGRWRGWRGDEQARWVWLWFAIVAATWSALFLNNAPSLWSGDGFDGVGHLEYIRFVQETGPVAAGRRRLVDVPPAAVLRAVGRAAPARRTVHPRPYGDLPAARPGSAVRHRAARVHPGRFARGVSAAPRGANRRVDRRRRVSGTSSGVPIRGQRRVGGHAFRGGDLDSLAWHAYRPDASRCHGGGGSVPRRGRCWPRHRRWYRRWWSSERWRRPRC